MADGGGSSSGAGAGAAASAAGSGAAAGSEAGAGTAAAAGSEAGTGEAAEAGEAKSGETKVSEKVGEVIDGKAVTVKEVNEKSTINKPHVEGEEKKPEEIKPEEKKPEEVKKHKYHDRLSKAFPQRQFTTDDEYEEGHEEYVKGLEGYKERGIKANQSLIALFEAEPQIADVVTAMLEGATWRSALARHIGPEDLVPEEGDPDYSVWDKNNKERLERLDKTEKFNKEFNENLAFSEKSVQEFATENNLKPEEAETILGEFDNMLKDIFRGRVTKETLTKIMRAVKHDEAIQEAKKEGVIKGRNENIKAKEEEAGKKEGDGLPVVKKSSDTIEEKPEKPESAQIIDRIVEAGRKRSNF